MRLTNFALRVALILGLSPSAFGNALADGRAVLPPKWMVEAYLSDAVVKPSRDDIARAIIPGLGMVPAFMGGGKPGVATTWNPSDKASDLVLSNGNLTASKTTTGAYAGVRATVSKNASGFSFSVYINQASTAQGVGIAKFGASLTTYLGFGGLGESYGYASNGNVIFADSVVTTGPTFTTGDLITFGWDVSNFRWFKNGTLAASTTSAAGSWFPAVSIQKSSSGDPDPQVTVNFSPDDPSGYTFQPWG